MDEETRGGAEGLTSNLFNRFPGIFSGFGFDFPLLCPFPFR
jgi:hypothetical protein